jgi:pyrimidine-specific ribonucleoside hydrolase
VALKKGLRMRTLRKLSFSIFLLCFLLSSTAVLAHEEQTGASSPETGGRHRSEGRQLQPRVPVVLESYPTDPVLFQQDLRPFVSRIIALHGVEEWKAAVLTNELHRHLGIYSIVGVKMGILARETLNTSLDELTVESHAGSKPPFSCLNDGLQVATGASLGRGTIRVPETHRPTVEAVFAQGDRKLRLRLKDSVKDRITSDIQHAIRRYGDSTPEYFKEVRRLSIEYWINLKRREIFERELSRPDPS